MIPLVYCSVSEATSRSDAYNDSETLMTTTGTIQTGVYPKPINHVPSNPLLDSKQIAATQPFKREM